MQWQTMKHNILNHLFGSYLKLIERTCRIRFVNENCVSSVSYTHLKFGGLMMGTAADPRAEQAVSLFYRLYQDAVGNTARLIRDYMDGVITKEPLAKRFERNFE